jgi:predicted esterase
MKKLSIVLILLILTSCGSSKSNTYQIPKFAKKHQILDEEWLDSTRNRLVPVAFYLPKNKETYTNAPIVIISHGYNRNLPGTNKAYSYFAENLALQNYFVVSIQHELPTDDELPMTGNVQETRKPFWERGAENIGFVIKTLKAKYPQLDYNKIILLGHSNGGDMSVLFTVKNPNLVYKLITLDHRRMVIPRVKSPQIMSLRSSDQLADDGVLPSEDEQINLGIKIVKLPTTIHNEMNDGATEEQKKEMWNYILTFIKE